MIPTTNTGGRPRKYRNNMPSMSRTGANSSIIKYSALGGSADTTANGNSANLRYFIGGNTSGIGIRPGITIVGNYDTCKFMPGTKVEWLPNLGSTTGGRVFACFVDNPERARNLFIAWFEWNGESDPATKQVKFEFYRSGIQGSGNVVSWPVWMSKTLALPSNTRRKRFDVDKTIGSGVSDPIEQLSRSMQQGFFYCVDASAANVNAGSFLYHDVVNVEGIGVAAT